MSPPTVDLALAPAPDGTTGWFDVPVDLTELDVMKFANAFAGQLWIYRKRFVLSGNGIIRVEDL